jgi:RNA-binding protein
MNGKLKKKLRAIGHGLKAVVTVAGNGLSENVIAELNRALDDHELIKLKIFGDKAERAGVVASLMDIPETAIVQVVGGMALIYRASREPNPALSNISRANVH